MGKYIDADRLRAEIERRKEQHQQDYESGDTTEFHRIVEDDAIVGVIDSLQQDHRFPQYDNIVDKVFGAGNLESWEYEEAEMLVALAKEELLNSLQQEQSEVDLEEEINRFLSNATMMDKGKWKGKYPISEMGFGVVARHFAKWQKERMMKEAVEGEFLYTPYPTIALDDWKDYNFTDFDKVRIIIVKED